MCGVNSLLYSSVPISPNINTFYTVVDGDRCPVFRTGHWVQTSGLLCCKLLSNLWYRMLPIRVN